MSLLLLASVCVQNEGNSSAFMYCDFLFGICFLSVFLLLEKTHMTLSLSFSTPAWLHSFALLMDCVS